MEIGDKVIVKDNLEDELLKLAFDDETSKSMADRFVGTEQEVLELWTDDGQEYATVDLCCEIPVQCLEVMQMKGEIKMDELLFVGIDVEKATRKIINEKMDELGINDMSEAERKAFDYGVDLVYQLIGAVTILEDCEDYVVLTNDEEGTEYTLEELIHMAEENR